MRRSIARLASVAAAVCVSTVGPVSNASGQALTVVGTIPGAADFVALHEDTAYVAAGRTLSIVDLADPAAPIVRGRLDLPDRVWAIRVAPPLAFVALDLSGLAVVDISNAAEPRLRSVLKLPGQTVGVSSEGTRVLAANLMSGVEFIDVSNPAAPQQRGAFFTDGYARDVTVSGSTAYVIDQPTGFSVLDLSGGGTPETAIGVDQTAETPLAVAASEEPIAGKRIVAVVNGRGVLLVYDVSNPAMPRKAATFKTAGRATRLALQGARLYIADGPAGLQVISLANPESPVLTTTWTAQSPVRDVAASRTLVVVVAGPPGQGTATILR